MNIRDAINLIEGIQTTSYHIEGDTLVVDSVFDFYKQMGIPEYVLLSDNETSYSGPRDDFWITIMSDDMDGTDKQFLTQQYHSDYKRSFTANGVEFTVVIAMREDTDIEYVKNMVDVVVFNDFVKNVKKLIIDTDVKKVDLSFGWLF